MSRRVRSWAEFRQEWEKVKTQAAEEVLYAMVDEEAKANDRMEKLENQVAALHARLDVRQTGQETQPVRIRGTQFADEEAKANERMAHLTGICPKCGDGGWWIDDDSGPYSPGTFHYCDCPEGVRAEAEEKQARLEAGN